MANTVDKGIKLIMGKERRRTMRNVQIALICLSVLGFVLAVISVFVGTIAGVTAEGFSQACTNLAIIAIAISVCCSW
jgi:ABC-type antimicrobial peptide transport system permease subunit